MAGKRPSLLDITPWEEMSSGEQNAYRNLFYLKFIRSASLLYLKFLGSVSVVIVLFLTSLVVYRWNNVPMYTDASIATEISDEVTLINKHKFGSL